MRPGAHKLVGLIVLALGLPALCHSLTVSDIETQVRRNVHDTGETGRQSYTDATLLTWINDAQREIVNLTWCVQTSTSYVLSAGTTFYSLPDNFLGLRQGGAVIFTDNASQTYQLQEMSETRVYETQPDFEHSSSGAPVNYFTRYPGDSDTTLEISYLPVPTSASVGTVKVWYYYMPDDMTLISDIPFDGFNHLKPYHWALIAHVTSRIKALEGKYDEATFFLQEFQRIVTTMADKLGRAPNYKPSAQGAPR